MEKSELLKLLEQQERIIDEKIRSDKVLEGLLKEISESLEMIAISK